jgi:hypothetical protein
MKVFDGFNRDFNNGYSPEEIDSVYDYVSECFVSDVKNQLDQLTLSQTRRPPVALLKGSLKPAIDKVNNYRRKIAYEKKSVCRRCFNSGQLTAKCVDKNMKEKDYSFSFRCTFCTSADAHNLSAQIPAWRDQPGFAL